VKFLVDKGADVHGYRKSSCRTSEHANSPIPGFNGFTSLLIASQLGYLEVVKFLVERGADVNAPGTSSHGMSEACMDAYTNSRIGWIH
jgi:ankyrin repeat protein